MTEPLAADDLEALGEAFPEKDCQEKDCAETAMLPAAGAASGGEWP